ncbi:ATP-binding protein [Streptomyces sp. NPDC059740]|uniref:ATP-binding protein n=1 Tax=Streptomyces sp. NPDC059740 TaxID=3346926 RepID=UPI003650181F
MSMWWSFHLRREAASVPLARRLLLGTMETAGVDPDVSFDLSVALTEACANAVEHGGGADCGNYRVTAYIVGDTCRIEVTDSGPGLREQPAPVCTAPAGASAATAESGRGLCMIEALTDRVRYRSRSGRRGTTVSFDKALKWREGAPLAAL